MLRIQDFLFTLALLGQVAVGHAVPVVNWVTTNGDAGFEEGTAATSSPVVTDADAETLVGSFPSVTLGDEESITLTGSLVISGRDGTIPGNQIRWALFDAPGVPETGDGTGYVGVWATVAGGGAQSDLRTADGSTDNPFSSSATTTISGAADEGGGSLLYDTTYSFSMTIKRVDGLEISVSATITDGVDFLIEWSDVLAPASPSTFTYDSVGILLGGTTNATSAVLTDVEVETDLAIPSVIEITAIDYDLATEMITLTWTSVPGKTYAIDASDTLESWPGDINDSVPAAEASEETSFVFEGNGFGGRYFFRIREVTN